MKTILIPTDFSDIAFNAAKYGVELAKSNGSEVILLHAYHMPVPPVHDMPFVLQTPEELQNLYDAELKQLALKLNYGNEVKITCKAILGFTIDVIIEQEPEVHLIVMGSRGKDKIGSLMFGSLTLTCLRKSKVPVLVIPENAAFRPLKNIVFACDLNPETSIQTLKYMKELLALFDASILILNVKPKHEEITLEESIAGVRVEGSLNELQHFYYFADNEDPMEGINEFVKLKNADMVAIIPHQYNIIENLFHKSVSKQLLINTHVPMLSCPEIHAEKDSYEA